MIDPLADRVRSLADELGIPGVAVGVFHEEREWYAFHGVTSVENPLAVDAATLFQFGSTGKTYTSVALLRLVEVRPGRSRRTGAALHSRAHAARSGGRRIGDGAPAAEPHRRLGR